MNRIFYRLRLRYYQYNDGSSNNGYFNRAIEFDNKEEAIKIRDIINKAIEANEGRASVGQENDDIDFPDYIPGCCGGFYTSVKLFSVCENAILEIG